MKHKHVEACSWFTLFHCVKMSVALLLQRLCDYVCDLLLEESNVQPVSTPVTVCGDIHGQVDLPHIFNADV